MHLKKSWGFRRSRIWERSGSRSQSLVFLFLFFCFLINLHTIALHDISTFPFIAHCIRTFVHSLHLTCPFSYILPHPVRSLFRIFFLLYYPLAITRVICLCDERRFPYPPFPFPPLSFLPPGFRFFLGMGGGLVWRNGLAWLCKSSPREEFILGKGVMHGRLG